MSEWKYVYLDNCICYTCVYLCLPRQHRRRLKRPGDKQLFHYWTVTRARAHARACVCACVYVK